MLNYSKSVPLLRKSGQEDPFRQKKLTRNDRSLSHSGHSPKNYPMVRQKKLTRNDRSLSHSDHSPKNYLLPILDVAYKNTLMELQPTDKVKIPGRVEVTKEQLIKEMSYLYQQIEEQKKENSRLRFDHYRQNTDISTINKLKAELHRVRTQMDVSQDMLQTEISQVAHGERECDIMRQAMLKAVSGADEAAEKVAWLTRQTDSLAFQLEEVRERAKIYKVDIESLTLKLAAVETAHMACPTKKELLQSEIEGQTKLVADGKKHCKELAKEIQWEKKQNEELAGKVSLLEKALAVEKGLVGSGKDLLKEATLDRDKALIDQAKVEAKVDGLLNEVREAHLSTNTAEDAVVARDAKVLELTTRLEDLKSRFGVKDDLEAFVGGEDCAEKSADAEETPGKVGGEETAADAGAGMAVPGKDVAGTGSKGDAEGSSGGGSPRNLSSVSGSSSSGGNEGSAEGVDGSGGSGGSASSADSADSGAAAAEQPSDGKDKGDTELTPTADKSEAATSANNDPTPAVSSE